MTTDLSETQPIGDGRKRGHPPTGERDWSKSEVPERRCTAHRKSGEQCKNASLAGATVCRYHGGAAKQVVQAARIRLQNAADKMARELLGMATDPNVSDSVKLAAIRDALDRAGLKPVTAVDLDISTKPWEKVFEGISKVVAGPREAHPALANESESAAIESGDDSEVIGEIDDDEIDDDPYLPAGFQQQRGSESADDPEIIDVEIEGIDPSYNDAGMSTGSGTTTPDQDQSAHSDDLGLGVGPLGMGGPVGSGLMSLADAVEAQADMRAREAARIRDMRRR